MNAVLKEFKQTLRLPFGLFLTLSYTKGLNNSRTQLFPTIPLASCSVSLSLAKGTEQNAKEKPTPTRDDDYPLEGT